MELSDIIQWLNCFTGKFVFSIIGYAGHEKSEIDYSEDEKKTRLAALKKKAINASNKFRNSLTKKGRRNSKVMSVSIDHNINAEDLQAVDAFRQALILDELLPSKHDDHHMLLRLLPLIHSFLSPNFKML